MENSKLNRFHVLFCDSLGWRHAEFRIEKGSRDKILLVDHAYELKDLQNKLYELQPDFTSSNKGDLSRPPTRYNTIFLPAFWQRVRGESMKTLDEESKEAARLIIDLPKERYPDLVIFHGLVDDSNVVKRISAAGIPAAHVPWNYTDPAIHERTK